MLGWGRGRVRGWGLLGECGNGLLTLRKLSNGNAK
jgi:hypothetical protein